MVDVPRVQEKSEQIFFAQPKAHQNKFADLNKTVPSDPLRMIAFFEQCQATDKAAGILDKIAKDKKQPKENKTAHLPTARSHESSYHQRCSCSYCDYHQSNQRNRNNHRSDYCHQDDRHHDCPRRDNKDSKSPKSYDKKDDCKRDYSKKKSNKAMHNDQSSKSSAGSRALAICPEEEVDLVQDLHALNLGLALAQAVGAMTTIMSIKMIASRVQSPSAGTCTSLRVTRVDAFIALTKAILFLPPSPLQRQRRSAPRNRESRQ